MPRNVAVKQLDRFIETLQILTFCQFGEVTFEGVIEMNTVLGLFRPSWVDYEHDKWLKITSVPYYPDDILYSVVRSTAPDTEVWIRLIPSRNSRIKFMFDQ